MKQFDSKVDLSLMIILVFSALFCFAIASFIVFDSFTIESLSVTVFVVLLGSGLPVWLAVSNRYCVDQEILVIKSGPFRWRIPLNDIKDIRESSSPISGPALSFDRLLITYSNGKRVLVSPKDKTEFKKALSFDEQLS